MDGPDPNESIHWQRNARTLAAGNFTVNVGWVAAFAFLPLVVSDMVAGEQLGVWVGVMVFSRIIMVAKAWCYAPGSAWAWASHCCLS